MGYGDADCSMEGEKFGSMVGGKQDEAGETGSSAEMGCELLVFFGCWTEHGH